MSSSYGRNWRHPLVADIPIHPGAQMAAMSYKHNDLRYVQVLLTRKDGGVAIAYLDGGPVEDWVYVESVKGIEMVIALSPIAAT